MKTVVTVVGARPQFIKAALVSRLLRAKACFQEVLVHTGQHYDASLSDIFFRELEIPRPDHYLGVGSGTHGVQTGLMLQKVERVLLEVRPDWVLVYGDTNSTLAGALAGAKLHVPVAHVEAGLRSFNRRMPEELNRVLTDHAADLLLAPTETAVKHLRREGIPDSRIKLVGDVMYDAALYYGDKAERESRVLTRLGLEPRKYILVTVHRAENTDCPERLSAIVEGLSSVAKEVSIVWPLHPRTRAALTEAGLYPVPRPEIRLTEPVGYLDMVMLEKNALAIVTDSGGVQKEAFFYGVPCATLRDETEWTELLELGWNRLVPPRSGSEVEDGICRAMVQRGRPGHPYGDGRAAQRIVAALGG
ncbi:MAG: non-hydrolyzing UDP-N-acetylglucosamine 2-epimerase [Betaproteobacteria bacterium]